ncbi:MAG: dTDP-4-dehydrorhamnose 3,5-epimerase [Gemmataceae bacterium]|nr:dTDP-4-dehydrorhamnose 3,5-epimerase [Gemmataceae bacterium]
MTFREGPIDGIIWKPLSFYRDQRGWLCELFRHDELPQEYHPVMAYMSMTEPGIARGPHEHIDQSDYFCFIGPSDFKMYLWDARPASPTFGFKEVKVVGESAACGLVVPPGVVHAYKNVGNKQGVVFNGANRLYKGWEKKDVVDEIRHEEQEGSLYRLD